jgi:hypothetical protein
LYLVHWMGAAQYLQIILNASRFDEKGVLEYEA